MNIGQSKSLATYIATSPADILAAQKLRYVVFAEEFHAKGTGFDHHAMLEHDAFDRHADHLVLKDSARPEDDQIVGVYRLMRAEHAAAAGRFYSAAEFDLSSVLQSGLAPLELSRSCLHPDYRGGTALLHLWQGLGAYVAKHDIDVLFGVASFPGASVSKHAGCLALLHHDHLAPSHMRPMVNADHGVPSAEYADVPFDRREAMIAMPALIKAYLRMGGVVGDGAFLDTAFGTTDVCMILKTAQLNARQRAFLGAASDG